MQKEHNIRDINIKSLRQLITPIELLEEIPMNDQSIATVAKARADAKKIINGIDDRLLVVVGPCSIHNQKAAVQFGQLLQEVAPELKDELCIIMRVYFEKPRTTVGWKGLINDPDIDGSYNINVGLRVARDILLTLNNIGVAAATEFLDTTIPQYLGDLISWGAIGARTTESQIHRELASGLSMPIVFKNGTDGNIDIAIDAICAASYKHHFLGITKSGRAAIVGTNGNDACHIILRGAKDHSNYDAISINRAACELTKKSLPSRVMIDCSHGNSQKQYQNQVIAAHDIAEQISSGSEAIMGIMLESHLVAGNQALVFGKTPRYDQSVTDACLSWEETKPLLIKLAEAVKARRKNK